MWQKMPGQAMSPPPITMALMLLSASFMVPSHRMWRSCVEMPLRVVGRSCTYVESTHGLIWAESGAG